MTRISNLIPLCTQWTCTVSHLYSSTAIWESKYGNLTNEVAFRKNIQYIAGIAM